MSGAGWDFSFTKKGRRELSPFMAQEMLYDYVTGRIDEERRIAFETHLETSREAKQDLAKLNAGLQFAERLAATRVQVHVLEEINEPETYLSVVLKKTNFEQWPLTVKWGLEALVVISVLVVALIAVPWEKALRMTLSQPGKEVVLAEIDRSRGPEISNLKEAEKNEPGTFEDEGVRPTAVAARAVSPSTPPSEPAKAAAAVPMKPIVIPEIKLPPPSPPNPAPKAEGATAKAEPLPAKAQPPSAPATKSGAPPSPRPTPASPTKVPVAMPILAPEPDEALAGSRFERPERKSGEGILYRGRMLVANLPAVGPRITEKIMELGGRKAGEVELGWKKTPRSYYYHFTIPEAKYDELTGFLGEYGSVKIEKGKHPRVMPEGIIRLLITIEEATP